MYELLITEFAEQDLDNVEACYESLRRKPRMFAECVDTYLKRKGYRKALINNYPLIFRIDGKARRVFVLRCFYAGQDYIKQL